MAETDARLVLKTLQGDKMAFGELYDKYARLIRVICYDTTRDQGQGQDLAQETFLRAYEKLNRLDDPDRFGAWLVSIARNVCREFRRGKLRDRHQLVGLTPPDEPESVEISHEQLLDLRDAMSKLSEKERLALHVYYLQEQDVDSAKNILNVSRSSFFRLLARARKKIENYLEKKESPYER
ncbi:MAG: sigma-70 family RNA polymerase sigma factor [Sedimentisphaerales bacterium]|nr:sigma-70 family RNA polymerase sigma factor [Sedimentisphaerales bacterium]